MVHELARLFNELSDELKIKFLALIGTIEDDFAKIALPVAAPVEESTEEIPADETEEESETAETPADETQTEETPAEETETEETPKEEAAPAEEVPAETAETPAQSDSATA